MSYTPVTIPNLREGEYGYELDGGSLVAVTSTVERTDQGGIVCAVAARHVDADGGSVVDTAGNQVYTAHRRHLVDSTRLDAMGGISGLVKATMEIAFGEPTAVYQSNDHIRHAIKAASLATPAFDLSTL